MSHHFHTIESKELHDSHGQQKLYFTIFQYNVTIQGKFYHMFMIFFHSMNEIYLTQIFDVKMATQHIFQSLFITLMLVPKVIKSYPNM